MLYKSHECFPQDIGLIILHLAAGIVGGTMGAVESSVSDLGNPISGSFDGSGDFGGRMKGVMPYRSDELISMVRRGADKSGMSDRSGITRLVISNKIMLTNPTGT